MTGRADTERMAEGIIRLWHEVQRRKGPASTADLTTTQARALRSVSLDGPQRMGALASTLGVTVATASRTVDALERAGFVRRETDPADARGVRVVITPVGKREHTNRRRRFFDALDRLSSELSEVERRRLAESLEALAHLFEDQERTAETA
ncbi:MAG TPA: MarR family transcriptional regulator [Gaiellaceae bacterium]|jgi:DNA-binding MarR family transcriptional regulator